MPKSLDDSLQESLQILNHPARRRVLQLLWEKDRSFVELTNICAGNHGKLGYHLRKMRNIVEHDSDAKVYRLSDEGRLVYACYLRTLSNLANRRLHLTTIEETTPTGYLESLSLGDHGIFFYENDATKRSVSIPFLRLALHRKLAAIWIVSERKMDCEVREMKKSSPDIAKFEQGGALTTISSEEWYLRRGRASPDVIIANWLRLAKEKMRQGYRGLQAAAETDAFLNNAKTDLLVYEKKIGRNVSRDICALCMYETPRLETEQLVSLIKAHSHCILGSDNYVTFAALTSSRA